MKIGDKSKIEIYPEMCCDECGEIVHNHIDCPVCKRHNGTDNYCDLYLWIKDDPETRLVCECGAKFKYVGDLSEIYWDSLWERVE